MSFYCREGIGSTSFASGFFVSVGMFAQPTSDIAVAANKITTAFFIHISFVKFACLTDFYVVEILETVSNKTRSIGQSI